VPEGAALRASPTRAMNAKSGWNGVIRCRALYDLLPQVIPERRGKSGQTDQIGCAQRLPCFECRTLEETSEDREVLHECLDIGRPRRAVASCLEVTRGRQATYSLAAFGRRQGAP
jgi:hypothetical protein